MEHSRASATSLLEVIPNARLSCTSATALNARAPFDSRSSKNPIRTTSSFLENFFAASTSVSSMVGGPVFFCSQFTISAAVLPPIEGGGGLKSAEIRKIQAWVRGEGTCRINLLVAGLTAALH